jgi:hypothetical protein
MQIFDDFEQNSPQWYQIRAGCVTASQMKTVLARGKGGKDSLTRQKYLYTLAGEILTGEPAETYSNHHMQRGHLLEEEARSYYSLITNAETRQVGFIRNGNVGASPDSLIGERGLLEIKTALPSILLGLIIKNAFPPEHKAQTQGQLMVAERDWVDICCYWPKIPPFIKRAYRDEPYIRMLADEVDRFNDELAAIVAKIRAYGGLEAVDTPETPPVPRKPSPWAGLRPAVRLRLSEAVERLRETGTLNRADIQRIGEVSMPQASSDIAEIKKRFPDLMRYDRSAKCYVLVEKETA